MFRRSRDCYYGWVEGGVGMVGDHGKSWKRVHSAAAAKPGSDDELLSVSTLLA